MRLPGRLLLVAWAACGACAWGAPGEREPHIGYLYPAGGRQGTVFQVTTGGQYLGGVNDVYVSGDGVRARVVWYARPVTPKDLQELRTRLLERWRQRRNPLFRRGGGGAPGQGLSTQGAGQPGATDTRSLSDHPVLRELEKLSLEEIQKVVREFFGPDRKRQPNAQSAETALIEVTIDPDAAPGDRELRLGTPFGLTNPMRFQVGSLPEVCENEPFGVIERATPTLDPPVVVNGQITPGDVDRFRLRARRGQQLVVRAQARRLIPYLADAVPGWFQAVLALYDAKGNQVAFADDYRSHPDPVLCYQVPEDGEYQLEIRDALYRGREDFVYRVSVGELPFITRMFPLGGPVGTATVASIDGWNLPEKRLPLDTRPGADGIRQAALGQNGSLSNEVPFAVDTLPERAEVEPNNTVRDVQRIAPPVIINGLISRPGDVDVFRFEGRAGEEVVAEVYARRLGSPLDSLLRLTDASGRVLAWNDDHEDREARLLTHHADSYLSTRLPKTGTYFVRLADSQQHGGDSYAYRLRVGPRRPDFAVRVTPSSANMRGLPVAPLCVHVLRRDGFNDEIEVVLKDAPPGFTLSGGRVPSGRDSVRITLAAPPRQIDGPVALQLEARARIGGTMVVRPVVPADDMMQAFAYRHLVPARELLVAIGGAARYAPPIGLADAGPVRIPVGGTAQVRVNAPRRPALSAIRLELFEPPKGVILEDVTVEPDGLTLVLKADAGAPKAGYADNLIVEAFTEMAGGPQNGRAANRGRRLSLGVLPAIPFEIIQR